MAGKWCRAFLVLAAGLTAAWQGGGSSARAQAQPGFTHPILVLNTGGHQAPVRALVFPPDGGQLLSGGMDKVVHVWNVRAGRPALEGTIRPPIWRGQAGAINALALSPEVDQPGHRVLAIAGYGVESFGGNIGLFHFPGSNALKTGDHFDELIKDDPANPAPSGHTNVVTSLAFDRRGQYLASGSNDTTARIWDWRNRRSVATLRGHTGPINAIAFTPDGGRLITAGRDGILRLWDIKQPAAPIATAPPPPSRTADALGIQINKMEISRDGRFVVIGREDGRLIRYDAANLGNETGFPSSPGTIEALALSHDGAWLVTSSIRLLGTRAELPRLTCSIQRRRFPGGEDPQDVIPPLDNIAYACEFSPDDQTLAVAGGDLQAIRLIRNWNQPAPQPQVTLVHGLGRSIWDVGLADSGGRLAVGYSHDQDQNLIYLQGRAAAPASYDGMILETRERTAFDPAVLSRALLTYQGWSVRPIDPFHLEVVLDGRPDRTFPIALNEVLDRRWRCYSFIPPGPEHPRLTLAVGCEAGVWFYRVDDGKPVRLYSGHSGPVYCLAPSKSGRWLATGSSDQTVRLWTLAGCDTLPTLGATFERRPGTPTVVTAVEPLSFAEVMGLRKGDIPFRYGLAGAPKEVTEDDFFARYESMVPNTAIEMYVRRRVEPPPGAGPGAAAAVEVIGLYTTKRNAPAVSLFVGEDREWVIWMPSGFYDTSIAGDTKFLGWHLNMSTIFLPRPTDYLEIIKFEKQLRQPWRLRPNKLDTLLSTADPLVVRDIPPSPMLAAAARLAPAGAAGIGAGPGRLDARPGGAPAPAGVRPAERPALPPLAAQPPAGRAIDAGGAAPEARPAAPGNAAGLPAPVVAVLPDAAGAPPNVRPSAQPLRVAQRDASAGRIVPRPDAPVAPALAPPAPGQLGPVVAAAPQPRMNLAPAAAPRNPGAAAPPEPAPAPAPAPAAAAEVAVAVVPAPVPAGGAPAPGPGPRINVPPGPAPPGALAAIRAPLPPVVLPNAGPAQVPAPVFALPPAPAGARPAAGAGAALAALPPPLEPAEFVERAQPPVIEPRIQPQPNQQVTTLDGKPIDFREVPPDKIAVGDLGPDGRSTLQLDLMIDSTNRSPARSIDLLVDGHRVRPTTVFDQPLAVRHEAVKLSLAPGPHKFTAEVENDLGVRRSITREILVRGLPQARPTRLRLVTIAPAFQESRIPRILFSDRDVKDLRAFLGRYLVSPENEKPIYSVEEDFLEGEKATSEEVTKAIAALNKDTSFGEGDLVVVVIESHFINVSAGRRLVTADGVDIPPNPAIAADELGRSLGALAARGCKVLVLVDGVHTASNKVWDTDISDWVRNLRDEQNVIAFVASNSGPSLAVRDQGHRAFAQAILDSIQAPQVKDGAYSLNDFRDVVINRVLQLTGRQQQAGCYLPESISGQFPLINPQSTGR
jgi:WD40 repeat protein